MALDTVIHSVLQKSRKKLIMASLRSHALMAWAFATKRVEFEDGNYRITNPITLGRNPNVQSYQYFDPLPVAQTNEFDTLEYTWSRVGGTVIIADQEEDENRGESMIFKLLKAKMEVLEESFKEKFSTYLYGLGTGTDPYGLAALIPDDPTAGSLGGISRVSESQWRTSAYLFAGSLSSTNIAEAWDDVMMDLTLKGDKPDIILAGRDIIRDYRTAARDKSVFSIESIANGKRMADLGFSGFTHQNIPMVYDEDCPPKKAYFINSKYLRLHILRHVNMKVKKLIAPWNIDAAGRRMVWQGQWCMWRAFRTHAVVSNVA